MGETIEQILSRASDLHRRGDVGEAEDLYRFVLDNDPGNADATNLLGVLASDQGYHEEAVELIGQAIERQPDNPYYLFSLGNAFLCQDLFEDAEHCYRQSLDLDPNQGVANQNLAVVLRDQGKFEDAEVPCARAVEQLPPSVATYHLYAEILLHLGRHDDVVKICQKAADLEPKNPEAHKLLGNALKNIDDLDGAIASFEAGTKLMFSPGPKKQSDDPMFTYTTLGKLEHDIQQFEYLLKKELLNESYEDVVRTYTEVVEEMRPTFADDETSVEIPPHLLKKIASTYNRHCYLADAPKLGGPAVNPDLNGAMLEQTYKENGPGYVCVDDFLTPEALESFRNFCLESTIWNYFRYSHGRVSAMLGSGFFTPLLSQISDELRGLMPNVFADHKLNQSWGYKYNTHPQGITEHADFAAVNINFWITPDVANKDPDSGGLVVWDKPAPIDWTFAQYQDPAGLRNFLVEEKAEQVVFPHRQNRVLIFNSNLVHMTDKLSFKPGYENHRINVTMLYGDRKTVQV
jgi:tetratricopeptide (TPR) repeat protein